jgi:TatD DNase family protein
MYIDFHTHKPLHSFQKDCLEVISMHSHVKYENVYYTFGHHPWWTTEILTDDQLSFMKATLSDKWCLGIGECGLDKLKGGDKQLQEAVFLQHILLANEMNVPLIIHCVRQYDQVLSFRKKYGHTDWVIHGFRRNQLLAKSLLDQGIKLSVAPFINMNPSFEACLQYLPLEAFFIETDSDYSLSISERYSIMAELKKINTFDLQNQMIENFNTFFKWKNINLTGWSEQNY